MRQDPVVLAKSLESKIEGFVLGDSISGGNQGAAFRATINGVPHFAKIFALEDREIEDAQVYRFYREGKVLTGDLPNTPRAVAFSTGFKNGSRDGDIAYIVSSFFDGVNGRNVRLVGAPFASVDNASTQGMNSSSDASSSVVPVVDNSPRKVLPASSFVGVADKLFDTLSVAHARGIIHRDIKPENLMFSLTNDDVCVVDWGLARFIGVEDKFDGKARIGTLMGGTQQGTMVGTPFYASPEQIDGTAVPTGKIDVWGSCATLYNLATGNVPFYGSNTYNVLAAIGGDKVSSWASISNSNLSPYLSFLIHRGLTVSPYLRPSSDDMSKFVDVIRSKNLFEPSGFVWGSGSGRDRVLLSDDVLGERERVHKSKIDILLNRIFYAESECGLSEYSGVDLSSLELDADFADSLSRRVESFGLIGALDWVSNSSHDEDYRFDWLSLFENVKSVWKSSDVNSDSPLSLDSAVDKELELIEASCDGLTGSHLARLRVALKSKEDVSVAGFLGYCCLDVLSEISPFVGSVFSKYIDSNLNEVYSILSRGSSNVKASSDSVDEFVSDPVFIEEDVVDRFRSAFSEGGSRRAAALLKSDSDDSVLAAYREAQQEYIGSIVDRLIGLYQDVAELLLDGPDLGASRLYLLSRASDLVLLKRMTSSVEEGVSLEQTSVLLWNALLTEEKRCKHNKIYFDPRFVSSSRDAYVAREERSRREEAYRDMRSEFENSEIYQGLQVLSSQRKHFASEDVTVTKSMRFKAFLSTDRKLRNERREFAGTEYVKILSDVEKMLEFYSNPISVESSQVYDEHAALSLADDLLARVSELKKKYKHNVYIAPTLDRVETTLVQGRNYLSKIVVLK